MIKCNRGNVEVKGDPITLKAEFATIVHAMRFDVIQKIEPDKDPEEAVMDIVKTAFKTEEELEKEVIENGGDLPKDILRTLLEKLEWDED